MDPRLITTVSPAVAKAAMDSGQAKLAITIGSNTIMICSSESE